MSRPADPLPPFILASSSPRRRDLLASAGLAFETDPGDVPEEPTPGEAPAAYVRRLARDKAREVARRRRSAGDSRPVLAADTVVVLDGEPLGKPADRAEARRMLERLSGRAHHVITGFCIVDATGGEQHEEVTTEVHFKQLRAGEIEAYLDTNEWVDKAGSYGVQGKAAHMVRTVLGSYTNVVGLPLCETVEALRRAGVDATEGSS